MTPEFPPCIEQETFLVKTSKQEEQIDLGDQCKEIQGFVLFFFIFSSAIYNQQGFGIVGLSVEQLHNKVCRWQCMSSPGSTKETE